MFTNIGSKIKALAQIVCWAGIIGSVISGIAIIEDAGVLGLMIILLGSLISWISSFAVYGFGQLIENTDKIVSYFEEQPLLSKNTINSQNEEDIQKEILQKAKQKDFISELEKMKTYELELILKEKRSSYTDEELALIENEYLSRPGI